MSFIGHVLELTAKTTKKHDTILVPCFLEVAQTYRRLRDGRGIITNSDLQQS